jgi:hypothetical protein
MMNVYFTVDTESSMGGAWRDPSRRPLAADRHIFCRIGEKDYGIGLITDVLGRFGFRATHFVETLVTLVNAKDEMRPVFDYLLNRNQDVQLHIHPTYHFYAAALRARALGRDYQPPAGNDLLTTFSEEQQIELLDEAMQQFQRFTGFVPVAFRAGCYAANRITLRCLRRLGILLDTSFNPCFPECSFRAESLEPNRVCRLEDVWEVPVSVARTPLPESPARLKLADPCSLSLREMQTMLQTGERCGQAHFVIVFHSFAAVKAKDDTYEKMRPDHIVIRRLHKLAEYLASRPDLYRVSTFGELARELPLHESRPVTVSDLGLWSASFRKVMQGMNRLYWL